MIYSCTPIYFLIASQGQVSPIGSTLIDWLTPFLLKNMYLELGMFFYKMVMSVLSGPDQLSPSNKFTEGVFTPCPHFPLGVFGGVLNCIWRRLLLVKYKYYCYRQRKVIESGTCFAVLCFCNKLVMIRTNIRISYTFSREITFGPLTQVHLLGPLQHK